MNTQKQKPIYVYNEMTKQKEIFAPLKTGEVSMYVCGPTVYDYFHVGNARPFVLFDFIRRFLEYMGYKVNYLLNFTDIDDKMIQRANRDNITVKELADKFIAEYYKDAQGLGISPATVHPKATEHMKEIIDIIEILIEKGHAYPARKDANGNSDVYFSTKSFKEYGKLSKMVTDDLEMGDRVDASIVEEKNDPLDFALWKSKKEGEPSWESPWGRGRPGWHIECSAMVKKYLGDTVGFHCGGKDLMFPHHENEIAQSEGCSGKQFVRYWLHNGFISIDSKKMSKSLGNFFTVREAAAVCGYESIRMFMLMSHYRSPLNYSGDILVQSRSALDRIKTARGTLKFIAENGTEQGDDNESEFLQTLPVYRERFVEAMEDDFNTADAISVIFELVRETNSIAAGPDPSKTFAQAALEIFDELTGVLGLLYADSEDESLDSEVEALIEARQKARTEKNWADADKIRDKLGEMGIVLEDTPQGVRWHRNNA